MWDAPVSGSGAAARPQGPSCGQRNPWPRGRRRNRRLGIVAWALLGREPGGKRPQPWLGLGQRFLEAIKTRHDALDVAVNHRGRLAKGDGRQRRRRIGADAGEFQQLRLVLGEQAAMVRRHDTRAFVQVSGPGVVAQPGPGLEHVIKGRRRQIGELRPARHKIAKIGFYGSHRGLLRHDFAEPDVVRIRLTAALGAPGQIAALGIVPGQKFMCGTVPHVSFYLSCTAQGIKMNRNFS